MKKTPKMTWREWIPLFMLTWIVFRVEQIHHKLQLLSDLLSAMGEALIVNLQSAADQFHAAIDSILSLFGGDKG